MLIGLPAGEARRAEEAGYQVRILKPGQHDLDAGLFPNQIDLRVHDDRVAQVWEGPRRLDLDALIGLPLSEARWRAEGGPLPSACRHARGTGNNPGSPGQPAQPTGGRRSGYPDLAGLIDPMTIQEPIQRRRAT